MRILFLSNRYPPYLTGGYEVACQAIAESLRERGHEVLVLTSNYGLPEAKIEGHVHRLLHRVQDSHSLLQLARWEIEDNRLLRQLVEDWKPDVIYAWALLQLFPSLQRTLKSLSVPVVFNVQDIWIPTQIEQSEQYTEAWRKPGSNLAKDLAKRVLRAAIKWQHPQWLEPITIDDLELGHIIFCSRFREQQHKEMGFPFRETAVIYNGIDVKRFQGEAGKTADGLLKVLFVGRLAREKGTHTVIRAISKLIHDGNRNIRLTVVGVPVHPLEYTEELRGLANNGCREHVEFIYNVPNHELPQVYREHDVLVFSSIGPEGFPVTLLEAMACGLLIVGTTTGGSAEILEDGANSLTYPPDDAVALAEQCRWIAENRQKSSSLALAGQEFVRQQFNLDKLAEQTERYLESMSAGR
jgi:glycosyltransferase involved in cell wall biosynthesis